ncbi:MAG: hypothetical protein WA821_10935 [Anaerolineales bacterium]
MNTRIRFPVLFALFLTATLACGPLTLTAPAATPTPGLLPFTQPTPTQGPTPTLTAAPPAPTVAAPQPSVADDFMAGDPVPLDSIAMKSQNEGWGISGAYVLTTADGGQTWREVTPPENLPSGAKNQAYGAFLDARTAWVVFAKDGHVAPEASIWRTTDGGHTWTPGPPLLHQVIGDSVWAEFAALDAKNVWALVRGVYVGAGTHHNHELFHSVDGGLTWTSLDGQVSDDYTGMVFADANFGLRTIQTIGAYAAGPPAYDVTGDGGLTWQGRQLPPPPDAPGLFTQYPYCETYQPVLLSARAIRLLVGCFDYNDPPKQFTSYFYASQDGGAAWQTVHLPDGVQAARDQLIYFDANNALLLGRDIYLSASDGQTWSFVKTVDWDGQFSFSDMLNGWAIARSDGEAALVQTTDGAAIWTVIKPIITQ